MDAWIWQGIFGSGAMTGLVILIIVQVQVTIHKVPYQEHIKLSVEDRVIAMTSIYDAQNVAITAQTTASPVI